MKIIIRLRFILAIMLILFLSLGSYYVFFSRNIRKPPMTSISGRRGCLYLYGIFDSPCISPYSDQMLLYFCFDDYCKLSKFALYSNNHYKKNKNIRDLKFVIADGYQEKEVYKFPIVYQADGRAYLLAYNQPSKFSLEYNNTIKDCAIIIDLSDKNEVEEYIEFILQLYNPESSYRQYLVSPVNFHYSKKTEELIIKYETNRYVANNITPIIHNKIQCSFSEEYLRSYKDHILINTHIVDCNLLYHKDVFKLDKVSLLIFSNGTISIKSTPISELPVLLKCDNIYVPNSN